MKLVIDIQNEDKVPFIMEFLKSQPYIKTKLPSQKKEKLVRDLKEAFNEVQLHRQGKIKLKTAEQLLNELQRYTYPKV